MWLFFSLSAYMVFMAVWTKVINNSKHLYLFLSLGILCVLSAFRASSIGNDTIPYLYVYTESPNYSLSLFGMRYELGYVLLNKIVNYFTTNSQSILIVSSVIISIGLYRFVSKYSKIPWMSVFLFFSLGYWAQTMNTTRQYLAIAILLLSYDFIKKKKLKSFIILVLIAALFHRTAIVFLLAYPIAQLRLNYKTIVASLLFALSGFVFFGTLLEGLLSFFPIYQYYLGGVYLNGEVRLATVMNILVALSILIFGYIFGRKQYNKSNKYSLATEDTLNSTHNEFNIFSLFLLVSIVIEIISLKFNLLSRVGIYFGIYSIVYLPNIVVKISDKNIRVLVILLIVSLFFIYSTIIQIYRPEWTNIYPYEFFWQE